MDNLDLEHLTGGRLREYLRCRAQKDCEAPQKDWNLFSRGVIPGEVTYLVPVDASREIAAQPEPQPVEAKILPFRVPNVAKL